MNMDLTGNNSVIAENSASATKMELYSIVLSSTILCLAILFGGGGCATVLIAMYARQMMRRLRYILVAILLAICCVFDFIWCPTEIARLVLHHQTVTANNTQPDAILDLKYFANTLYILLLCALAAIVVLISVQNLLKLMNKYGRIPKLKIGIILLSCWLLMIVSLTIVYIVLSATNDSENVYHSINRTTFQYKLHIKILWILLLLLPVCVMLVIYVRRKFLISSQDPDSESSDLHSTENFTVPTLLIKSVEELDEADDETSIALPSPDSYKGSRSSSPVSKSAMSTKRRTSPSSQKVMFADPPSPMSNCDSAFFSNKPNKPKSQNHLGVNMAAILGRRRHTIAQINEPQLDLLQKAKTYNYVRKFSVDISALQAQLENPKIHGGNFPFHSDQEISKSGDDEKEENSLQSRLQALRDSNIDKKKSIDDMARSQEIAEESELDESDKGSRDKDMVDTQSIRSQTTSVRSARSERSERSARDSMCPTPPLISLTQSDGEEKQIELGTMEHKLTIPKSPHACKMCCLIVLTFVFSILPLLITEALRDYLSPNSYTNIVTCTQAISLVQTMIYPQIIFCVDGRINKAVHRSFLKSRHWIMHIFNKQEEVAPQEEMSDTEV